jgi:hypothetical protein
MNGDATYVATIGRPWGMSAVVFLWFERDHMARVYAPIGHHSGRTGFHSWHQAAGLKNRRLSNEASNESDALGRPCSHTKSIRNLDRPFELTWSHTGLNVSFDAWNVRLP